MGVLLFELCTGRLPFDASDALGLALATVSDTPLRAHEVQPAVSQQMSDVITRAMTRERHDRYQSVESMRADLRRLDIPSSERTTTAAEIHVPPSASTPILSRTLTTLQQLTGGYLARAVAVVAAIVVGAWFIANQGGPTPSLTTTVTIAPTVAVLPFVNERDDPADDHLGVGLAEMIISALDGLPAVSVVSGSATLGGDATDADLATIASGLGATAIVQGSFSRDGDELEVSASLHAADGSEVWDDGYSDSFTNFFTMETVGVAAKKPGQHGATPVKWHITNDWTVAAKKVLVNFKPRNPFNAAGNKPTVSGGGGTGTLTRVVGPFSDRDTYSYQIQTTVGMASKPWDDPWLIVF